MARRAWLTKIFQWVDVDEQDAAPEEDMGGMGGMGGGMLLGQWNSFVCCD